MPENDKLLLPREVAERLGVDPKTVSRWAKLPKEHPSHLPSIRTLGGHRRYYESVVRKILNSH